MSDKQIRLLVVDDEADLLQVLDEAFTRRGMRVTTAGGGSEAVAAVKHHEFDVVLLDLVMPGMDGFQVLKRIKYLQPMAEVIVLTGHPTMSVAVDCLRFGAFEFLMKPQRLEALVAKVRQAHELRQLRCRNLHPRTVMVC